MEQDKDMIPEEKLLRLIENPSAIVPRRQKKPIPKFAYKGLKTQTLGGIALILANPVLIQRILAGLSLCMSVFLVFDFLKGRQERDRFGFLKSQAVAPIKINLTEPGRPLALSEYLAPVSSHNICLAPSAIIKKTGPEIIEPPRITINDLISQLKLVAIIWLQDSPQVMIEDTKASKTFLLNEGEGINQLTIKKIRKDRIILSYGSEEAELM